MSEYESKIHLETALSVAHDFTDAIVGLKAEIKILQDRIDNNNASVKVMLDERERQINALTNDYAKLNEKYIVLQNETAQDKSITDKEISTHAEKVKLSEQLAEKARSESASHLNTIRAMKSIITEKDNEIVVFKADIDILKKQIIDMGIEIDFLKEEISTKDRLLIDKATTITNLQNSFRNVGETPNETIHEVEISNDAGIGQNELLTADDITKSAIKKGQTRKRGRVKVKA